MFAVAGSFQDSNLEVARGENGGGQVKLTNQKTHVSSKPEGNRGKEPENRIGIELKTAGQFIG